MNYPQAIVAATGILAGSILMTNLAQPGSDRPSPAAGARYQIAATPGRTVANAWRLDLRTGELYRCFATGGLYGALCRRARFIETEGPHPDAPEVPDPDGARFTAARRWAKRIP